MAMGLDRFFAKRNSTASQLVAMLLNFIQESIIIGAIITKNYSEALLLAVIIFAQNLPESFNAFREMKRSNDMSSNRVLMLPADRIQWTCLCVYGRCPTYRS